MRRSLLRLFREGEAVAVETLARELVESDTYQTDGGENPEELSEITVALHHQHLPKMAEAGVIDYDFSARIVETTGNAETASDLLDAITPGDEA